MKKKIGDLTIRESKKYIDKYCKDKKCGDCPFSCNENINLDEEIEVQE